MTQDIEVVRGTTNTFGIALTDASGSAYTLQSGESLKFGVKSNRDNTTCEFTKTLTSSNYSNGRYQLTISPTDTENLPCGQYCYDIGLLSGSNYYSVIECSHFTIKHNVTSRT